MNNKYTVFLILAIVVIVFLYILQNNKKEHLDATPLSNESIQNIASVYNKDNLTATNINATGNLQVKGNITNGSTTLSGTTLNDTGRFHISSGELLYLLPKSGVIIGKEWGGTGNLQVQGNITNGSTTLSGTVLNDTGRFHISSGELLYLLPKSGVIIGKDWGANGNLSVAGNLSVGGGLKIPLDMTVHTPGAQVSLWKDAKTKGNNVMCPDGYYMAGIVQHWEDPQAAFFVQCRKLPGA